MLTQNIEKKNDQKQNKQKTTKQRVCQKEIDVVHNVPDIINILWNLDHYYSIRII